MTMQFVFVMSDQHKPAEQLWTITPVAADPDSCENMSPPICSGTDAYKTLTVCDFTFRASMTRSRASSSPSRMLKSISNSALVKLSMFSLDCQGKR